MLISKTANLNMYHMYKCYMHKIKPKYFKMCRDQFFLQEFRILMNKVMYQIWTKMIQIIHALNAVLDKWIENTLKSHHNNLCLNMTRSSEVLLAAILILWYLCVSAWHQMANHYCSFRTRMAAVKRRYAPTPGLGEAVWLLGWSVYRTLKQHTHTYL